MAKDPAVLWYPDHFLGGVEYMSMEDRGKYITLLCNQFISGHIPENHMISVCGSIDSPVIKKFVKDDDGNYYNERMELEKVKRASYCKSRSNPKSGRKKKKSYDKSYGNHTVNVNKDVNINTYKDSFNIFREKYPGTKRGNETEFKNFIKKHKDWKDVISILIIRVNNQIDHRDKMIDVKMFVPEWKNLATWINNRCWEDELPEIIKPKEKKYGIIPTR